MQLPAILSDHKSHIALTVGPPTAVAGLALATYLQYGPTAAAIEFTMALASGALSFSAFAKKWSPELAWASGAACLLTSQATITSTFGFDAPSFYGWVFNVGVAWAAQLVVRHRTRHDRNKSRMEESRIEIARIQAETAQLRLSQQYARFMAEQEKANNASREPVLTGVTPQETALRQAIWRLFKVELLAAPVEYLSTGDGWNCLLALPPELTREKLQAQWHQVSGALALPGAFSVSLGLLGNQLAVRYQEGDPLAATVPYEPSGARSFLEPVLLGLDGHLDQIFVELAYNHTLIAGSSKFGKSNLVKLIILRLASLPDSVIYGVDMKPGAPELSLMRPVLHDLAVTPEQAKALFQWLTQEMHERGDILAKAGDTAWIPDKHGRPAIWVVVDELGELVRQGDRVKRGEIKMSDRIESLLALARAYGIHLILATQTPSNRVFGKSTDPRGNLAVRLSTRMNDSRHTSFVFSGNAKYKPNRLDLPGKFLMLSPDHGDGIEYRAQFVSDKVAAVEIARLSLHMVPAPVGHRAILPAPLDLNNQERIRDRLERYGEMLRSELEQGCFLSKDQVLRALREMAPEVIQDRSTNLWSLRPEDDWAVYEAHSSS